MKSTEFITESTENSGDDVKRNHPEIYKFFQDIGAWMTFDHYAKVESYDTDNSHFVVVVLQPTAGLNNTMANMKSAGVQFERAMGGLSGKFDDTYWTMDVGGVRGNVSEKFRFAMPLKLEEDGEDKTPYDHLLGTDMTTNSGGVTYRGHVDKIIRLGMQTKGQPTQYRARVAYYNEPDSYFYKALGDEHLVEATERDIAWLENKIQKLSKNLNWKIDVKATAENMAQYSYSKMTDQQIFEFMREHGTEGFDEENASLLKKVQQVHRTGLVNAEFYADEVADAIQDAFGNEANKMTLDQIAKFITSNEFTNTGTL